MVAKDERRREVRYPYVRTIRCGTGMGDPIAVVKDMSRSGIGAYFVGKVPAVGETLPLHSDQPLPAYHGVVRWFEEESADLYRIGITFQ